MEKTTICFFDDYWLDDKRDVMRIWYSPQYAGCHDEAGIYPSAAWCPEAGKYRLWYEVVPDMGKDGVRYLALAESDNGTDWRQAEVDSRKIKNHPGGYGNVVYTGNGGIHGTCVFRDPYDKDPARLYKAAGMIRTNLPYEKSGCECPIVVSTSPDGINWTENSDLEVYPFSSDTYNCIFYNPISKKYCVTMRPALIDRRIGLIQSKNLKEWEDPEIIIHPDAENIEGNYMIQYYSMWAGWNEGMFLGLLWNYHTSITDTNSCKMNGFMDTELVYSYDGNHWMHTTRRPIVQRPAPPSFGHTQLNFSSIIETKEKDKWILVASASRAFHSSAEENKRLMQLYGNTFNISFYEIRKNGLCGMECCGRNGILTTKAFELVEPDLTFNLSAPFGHVKFSVTDVVGKPYEGFSFDDCVPFTGDSVSAVPNWKNHKLDELKGQRVRISLNLNTAVLYSLSATLRPYIVVRQISVNNPLRV